jgi:GDPmannose 4,6-dehydratase
MIKAVIWGSSGQDGYYLSNLLQSNGVQVTGVGRSGNVIKIDSTDFDAVGTFIKQQQPDYIFHFAANSTTRHSAWKENHDTISTGCLNILEAVKEYSSHTKVFLSGSGLQFKNEGKPIKETDPFEASSMYAATRIHSVYMARYYRSLGIKTYVGYFFNHDSPLRTERHINKKIIDAAKQIAAGSKEKLTIGDLSVKKEYGFAGDIVRAVWLLVQQEKITEAVIGTGKAYSIEEWVNICFSGYGLKWEDHIVEATAYIPEYKILVSDPALIFSLGWKPEVNIEQLAQMMN